MVSVIIIEDEYPDLTTIFEEKYSHLGVKVTLGDFNTGCQYGMATYVWVPEQK